MERPVGNYLRSVFLIHGFITAITGAALWLVPGRTLTLVGWVPPFVQLPDSELAVPGVTFINPVFVRLLGSALLALAYASLRAARMREWEQIRLLVQLLAGFSLLGAISLIVSILRVPQTLPLVGWLTLLALLGFAAGWGLALFRRTGGRSRVTGLVRS